MIFTANSHNSLELNSFSWKALLQHGKLWRWANCFLAWFSVYQAHALRLANSFLTAASRLLAQATCMKAFLEQAYLATCVHCPILPAKLTRDVDLMYNLMYTRCYSLTFVRCSYKLVTRMATQPHTGQALAFCGVASNIPPYTHS